MMKTTARLLILSVIAAAALLGGAALPVGARSAAAASGCPAGATQVSITLLGKGRLVSLTDVPACATGQLTVSFAGATAARCAAFGLCDYTGSDSFSAQGSGGDLALAVTQAGRRRTTSATLVLGGISPLREAVQRTLGGGGTASCSDSDQTLAILEAQAAHGTLKMRLATTLLPLLGTRCAGPLDSDLTGALPRATVSVADVLSGHGTIDLSGSRPFSAHGFSGTVVSTIAVTLGRPERRRLPAQTGTPGARTLTALYRPGALRGSVTASVTASPIVASCAPLDACGLAGTLRLTPGAVRGGRAFLIATERTRDPAGRLRAALGLTAGNSHGVRAIGAGVIDAPGSLTAALGQGASACHDRVAAPVEELLLIARGGRLSVDLTPLHGPAPDPLRTHCPGPELGLESLASATVPRSVLRRRTFTIALHGETFTDPPYVVRVRSTLRLTLTRVSVTTKPLTLTGAAVAQARAIDAGSVRSRRVIVTLASSSALAAPR